jgi:hypothetical protein
MTDDDMRALAAAVRAVGYDPRVVLQVYNAESQLDPSVVNPATHTQGLAQLAPDTLKALGYTGDPLQFHTLGVQGQLPWIQALLRSQTAANGGQVPTTPGRLMHLQLSPSTMGRGTVALVKGEPGYAANASLDRTGKGFVDEDDLTAFVSAQAHGPYFAALEQLARVAA